MSRHDVFRDGRVHVLADLCATCVFRPGNQMRLVHGRLAGMVSEAVANDSAIVCHSTLYQDSVYHAVCRGFYDRHQTTPLQIAERLDLITFVEVPA